MVNLSKCQISKIKSFLGLRSINPPIPFEEFLEKNINDLKFLIDNNQIIVIDAHGNEVDSSEWKEYITDYIENDREKINLNVDSMFFENDNEKINLDVDSMTFEHDDEDINLANEEEDINLDEDDVFYESNHAEDYSEKEIQHELEMINKIDNEEKTKIAYKKRLIQFLEEYDEPSRIILEKNLNQANRKIEELQNERKIVLDRINQKINDGADTSVVSNNEEQYGFEEEIQDELEPINIQDELELINKKDSGERAKIRNDNRLINSLGNYNGSYGSEIEKKVEKQHYPDQKKEFQSERKQVSSRISLETIDEEELGEIKERGGDLSERIKEIDTEEKAKIAHKNRLIESLKQCDGLEKDILEKGLNKTNQKIKELQSEREAVLIRINQENQQLG